MTQLLIVPGPDDLLSIFRKEMGARSVMVSEGVLIMISGVMIHCPGAG